MKIPITILALTLFVVGCQGPLSPATRADLQTARDQFAIQQQTASQKAATDLQSLKDQMVTKATLGQLSPAFHPLQALNQIVVELHPIAKWCTVTLAVAALIIWILSVWPFAALAFLPKLAVALTKGAVLSLGTWIAMNFLIWGLAIMIATFFVVWLIDSIKNHFDEGKTFRDMAAWVGIKLGASPAAAIAESKVASPPTAPKAEVAAAVAASASGVKAA